MESTRTFLDEKTGTTTLCFGPTENAAPVPTAPASFLQPAGDPQPSTPAPLRVSPTLQPPTLQGSITALSSDPETQAVLQAVKDAGGDPAAFLKNLQKQADAAGAAQNPNPPEETVAQGNGAPDPSGQLQTAGQGVEMTPDQLAQLDAEKAKERERLKKEAAEAQAQDAARAQNPPQTPEDKTPTPDELFAGLVGVVGAQAAKALQAGGIGSLAAAQAAPDEQLNAIEGVGEATIKKIRETPQA